MSVGGLPLIWPQSTVQITPEMRPPWDVHLDEWSD